MAGGAPARGGQVTETLGHATTAHVPVSGVRPRGAGQVRATQVVIMVDVRYTEPATNSPREALLR
uniref:hypothetical protein n=1 Tax=Stenotrophomonas sp. SrG TaxID=3414430 RepID=UPI003CF852E5